MNIYISYTVSYILMKFIRDDREYSTY